MKILKIIFFTFFLLFSNIAFGLDVPSNIILDKATDTSLDLSWDKVQGAGVYAISYGIKTASGGVYEHDLEIVVDEGAKGKIENLEANTKYFIAIRAYDSENNESDYSKEVTFSTIKKLEELKIENINVVDTKNIDIKFNLYLNKDFTPNLNIVNVNDDLENLEVKKYKFEGKTLKIFLDNDLKLENKYSITILTLEGANGETIKAGIDGEKEFLIDKNTTKYKEEKIEEIDLNSAGSGALEKQEEKQELIKQIKILGGKDIAKEENITVKIAKDKKDLPTTGPAETFLFLLFSLIAGGLFIKLRRKTNA